MAFDCDFSKKKCPYWRHRYTDITQHTSFLQTSESLESQTILNSCVNRPKVVEVNTILMTKKLIANIIDRLLRIIRNILKSKKHNFGLQLLILRFK